MAAGTHHDLACTHGNFNPLYGPELGQEKSYLSIQSSSSQLEAKVVEVAPGRPLPSPASLKYAKADGRFRRKPDHTITECQQWSTFVLSNALTEARQGTSQKGRECCTAGSGSRYYLSLKRSS